MHIAYCIRILRKIAFLLIRRVASVTSAPYFIRASVRYLEGRRPIAVGRAVCPKTRDGFWQTLSLRPAIPTSRVALWSGRWPSHSLFPSKRQIGPGTPKPVFRQPTLPPDSSVARKQQLGFDACQYSQNGLDPLNRSTMPEATSSGNSAAR